MTNKLIVIGTFAVIMAAIYMLCMCAVPRKGWLRLAERLCMGIILCYLCQLAAKPLGLAIAQSPLAALSAGCWGLPGVALSTFLAYWP